jgi:hypothetical protein
MMADSLLTDKRLWVTTAERAVLTFAQTLAAELAVFTTTDIEDVKLNGLPWWAMLSVAGVALIVSVLTSVAKGLGGTAGPGVDLRAERVEESFAHDDVPLPHALAEADEREALVAEEITVRTEGEESAPVSGPQKKTRKK